jgi:hypothetical protein
MSPFKIMEQEMAGELIPIVFFFITALIVWMVSYFRFKSKAETQQTIRLALDKGNELSPEFIERLGDPEPIKNKDLRRGLIWLGLAVGLALCGWAVPDPSGHALRGCLAGAAFPFAIGIAFLIMWRYASDAK